MTFHLFDPGGELYIHTGRLPHWYQPGATYFVTFRTCDSVPVALADQWLRRRADWLKRHGVRLMQPWSQPDLGLLTQAQRREYHRIFEDEFMRYLDKGYGECLLRDSLVANFVGDSLCHFNGDRYHLGDFVVMPNHVHVLVGLVGEVEIEAQCRSWKKYSATKINAHVGRKGRFWQEESFDHLVRTPEHFAAIQRYIADNPRQAQLKPGEYLYHQAP